MRTSAITSIASAFPAQKLTNEMLEAEFPEWSVDKISSKTGIATRYIAGENETALDLAIAASKKLFEKTQIDKSSIDGIIFCTQSPDFPIPGNASLLQDALGLAPTVYALDMNQGCSGYVYCLATGHALIKSGMLKRVLLITAETLTKHLGPLDKSVRTIFSDAGVATLLEATDAEQDNFLQFNFETDGSGAGHLIIPQGGCRHLAADHVIAQTAVKDGLRSLDNLFMNGPEIFNFSIKSVPALVIKTLEDNALSVDDIDYFVFHQANTFMLESLRRKCKIPHEKFVVTTQDFGNTASASIPLALEPIVGQNKKVFLVGFGIGLSSAACITTV